VSLYDGSGKPVAYLDSDAAEPGGFMVYGFNGKHLGWFVNGVIWDHSRRRRMRHWESDSDDAI
jgi:hypothetical protein